jgi:hypothetical protein
MKITFHPPTTIAGVPANPFVPSDPRHYPKGPGVYIYGLRLPIDNKVKFIPLYVGKHKTNVGNRIFEHYYHERMPGSSNKEIFDLTNLMGLNDVKKLYAAMKVYDGYRGKVKARLKINELIWFNDKVFFDEYISSKTGRSLKLSQYLSGSGHLASLFPDCGDLDKIIAKDSSTNFFINDLKRRIISSKSLFNDSFYYAYATVEKTDPTNILLYENSTKLALQSIGLHTTADAKKEILDIDIDLTNIQKELVNVGCHSYDYKNLIISIRK